MSLEDDIRTPPDAVWVRCPTRNWQGTCGPWTLERHRSDVAHAVRYVREDLAQSAELAALRERADALADLVENTLRLKAFPDIATAIVAYRNPDRHAAMLMAERVRDPDAKELEWAKQRARELGRD